MARNSTKTRARRLRTMGWGYDRIAKHLGVCKDTVRKHVDLEYGVKWKSLRDTRRMTSYRKGGRFWLLWVLRNSRRKAIERGHVPCTATVEEIQGALHTQDKRCRICGAKHISKSRLVMDHDHKTGKFRGWLCNRCNLGIGYMRDNPTFLRKAASYLENEL